MVIKVLGNCCSHCSALYTHTVKAIEELQINIPVEQEGDILKILQHKVLRTPALLINDKIVSDGEVLSVQQIKNILLNASVTPLSS